VAARRERLDFWGRASFSRTAAPPKSIGTTGMVLVEVVTGTATGDEDYNPNDANELIFLLGDCPKKIDAPGC